MVANLSMGNKFMMQVREELKSFLSIIMGYTEEQEEKTLEYFRENATSPKEISVIQELEKSTQEIEEQAQEYYEAIGISSTSKSKDNKSKKSVPHISESTLSEMHSTKDIFENEIEDDNFKGFDR